MDGKWDKWWMWPLLVLLVVCQPFVMFAGWCERRFAKKIPCEHPRTIKFVHNGVAYRTCTQCPAMWPDQQPEE